MLIHKDRIAQNFDLVGIQPKERITATYIKKFFSVKECKSKGKRAYLIIESLI